MKYKLQNLVDIIKLQDLLDNLYSVTGIASGIIDDDGTILTSSGWRNICINFHRKFAESNKNCIESHKILSSQIKKNYKHQKYFIHKCKNGLIDIGSPIIIDNTYVATIYQGQFFLKEPDLDYFKEQAKRFGYDEDTYLAEIKSTPIITFNEIKPTLRFLYKLAEMIAEMGLNHLRQLTAHEVLKKNFFEMSMLNTELITAKQELDRNYNKIVEYEKSKSEFFTNISHELRTPLNLILSALQTSNFTLNNEVEEFNNKDKILKYNAIMKQNSFRLIRLVNNLIDISQIDSNYFEINLKNCNIVNIIEEITLSTANFIQNNNMELIFDTDIEEKIIACDPNLIERIILNLLSNAVKFSEAGDRITVSLVDKSKSILIIIEDTGIGIPEDKQKNIFKRFSQVDKSLSRKTEGSGIGLSLVKSLVEMQNGTIELESVSGKGSKFIIELPARTIGKKDEMNEALSEVCCTNENDTIEKIHVEFSDIY